MSNVPLRSLVYYALCELSDATINLDNLLSRLEDESVKSLVSDIYNDVENVINKLHTLSL